MFLKQKCFLTDLVQGSNDFNEQETTLSLFLVESITFEFEKHCKLAKNNLLLASLTSPVYGPLSAIRSIIIQSVDEYVYVVYYSYLKFYLIFNFRIVNSNLILKWTNLINKLIDLCFDVSIVASSIVNSTSPEGLFPQELVTSLNLSFKKYFGSKHKYIYSL